MYRLEDDRTRINAEISNLQRDMSALVEKQRTMNEEVLTYDRKYEDKWKLLNEL